MVQQQQLIFIVDTHEHPRSAKRIQLHHVWQIENIAHLPDEDSQDIKIIHAQCIDSFEFKVSVEQTAHDFVYAQMIIETCHIYQCRQCKVADVFTSNQQSISQIHSECRYYYILHILIMFTALFLIVVTLLTIRFVDYIYKPKQPKSLEQPKVTDLYLQQLITKKKEIEQTMEQYNTPEGFSKYSKMQREIMKLDRQIEAQSNKQKTAETQQDKYSSPFIGKTMAYIIVLVMLLVIGSIFHVRLKSELNVFPISLILNDNLRVSGSVIVMITWVILGR